MSKNKANTMTMKRELQILRSFMNYLYMYRNITLDAPAVMHMLDYVDKLGRAQSVGNGEIDNDQLVKKVLLEMEDSPWSDSSFRSGIDTEFKRDFNKSRGRA